MHVVFRWRQQQQILVEIRSIREVLSSYESLANIVSAYEQILISDICNISEISNSWIERDREQSNQLKESNTLLDLLEHP